ncbi:AcrR family transcriptional regulator [Wenyingzhuangia heitensis]|uniref:AcrR family transcriptional regulator n=1 Tax=Wenyingzhuangia heitensis TaxID=1487859 RepID=A0ABX0UC35_9FLAO|nr:TetR/AcrR family transcriptional regulator [Wenyingzhuangia heitensis]NIJ46394.1 AcrR family transcriptional regulator [Wenyingzhuangia heitensis]
MFVKNHILKVSKALFFSFGIQNISMDDIANKCGVSKKTIYKHYENKSNLLSQTIVLQVEELKSNLTKTSAVSRNALEELHSFFKYINEISYVISPVYGKELKKFYPNKYMEVFQFKNEIIIPFVLQNIEKGIEEGLYKQELNIQETYESFDNISKIIFTSEASYSYQTNKNAVAFLNSLFMYRLVSVTGLKLLNELNRS